MNTNLSNDKSNDLNKDLPNNEGLTLLLENLIALQRLYYCDPAKKYSSRSKPDFVRSVEELEDNLKSTNVALNLKESGLIALDVDCPIIARKLLETIKILEINCYASSSPRGGCHVFFAKNLDVSPFRQGSVVTCLGFRCELFKTKPIVMFGPEYTPEILPLSSTLSTLPSYLYPLTERSREDWITQAEILKGSLIQEGHRNNVLFEYSRLMSNHLRSYREPALVIEMLAQFFCYPPYTESVTHITDRLTNRKLSASDPERKVDGENLTTATAKDLFKFFGTYKLVSFPADNKWFKFNEEDCLWKAIDEDDLKVYLWDVTEARGTPRLKLHAMESVIKELRSYCKYRTENFAPEEGLAFRNGFLNLLTFEFSPHEKTRFTPSLIAIDYDPEAQLSQEVKDILSFWVSGSHHYLNHLRGFIARVLLRPSRFRAGLVLSGPPRTGKSTLVNLIQYICQDDVSILREGARAFDRSLWRNARVVVINDCSRLDRATRENLRQLTGSDKIIYEMKYVQVSTDQAFRFRGVVIIVTNESKSELMSNTGDVALAQRFVEIPFINIPSTEDINTQLITRLEDSVPALINWALYVDPQVMLVQAGALNLDPEPSIFALFIMENLTFDKSSTITLSELSMRFSEHLNLCGVAHYELKTTAKRGIMNECAATFGCTITEGHSQNQRVLRGLRFLNKNNQGLAEKTNFHMSENYRLDHIDPWSTESRFILEDFEKTYRSGKDSSGKPLARRKEIRRPTKLKKTGYSGHESNQPQSQSQSQFQSQSQSQRLNEDDPSKKYSSRKPSKRDFVISLDDLEKEMETSNVALDLKESGLIALDVDCPIIAVQLLETLKILEINCYGSSSPRGGCHVFFAENQDTRDFNQGSIVTCLGFRCELFKSKPLVMFGPEYTPEILPKSSTLSPLPSYLYPLTQRCQEQWVTQAEILKGSLIQEGHRNNVLFEYSRLMCNHLRNYREPALVIEMLAQFFCSPPYTESVAHITDWLTNQNLSASDPELKEGAEKLTKAEELFQYLGPYKLVYDPADNKWFLLDEKDSLWKVIDEYDLRGFLWDVNKARGQSRLTIYTMKSLIEELKTYCKYQMDNFTQEEGLAFRNGFLNLLTYELSPHNKKQFTSTFLDIDYKPEAQLSQEVKEILSFWVSGSHHYLNHLRGFIARILLRPRWFRAGLVVSGPPRTGKSTLVNWIKKLCKKEFSVMREGARAFDRSLWRNARVVVINDCTKLEGWTREYIRQLTGSDSITYELKYVQTSTDQEFQFRGVVIIVTNYSKAELMSNTGDVALAQRFVEIPFINIPSTDQINTELMTLLEESIPALINWALHVDPQVMVVQAGALNLDSEPNIFASFILDHLVFEKSSAIRLSEFNMKFNEHLNLYGVSSFEIKTPAKRGIINECAATFGWTITEGRSQKQRVLRGLRFLNKNKDGSTEETNFQMSEAYRLDHIDPWSMEKRFILEDFRKSIRSAQNARRSQGSSETKQASRNHIRKPTPIKASRNHIRKPTPIKNVTFLDEHESNQPQSKNLDEDDVESDLKSQSLYNLSDNGDPLSYENHLNPVELEGSRSANPAEDSSDSGRLDNPSETKWGLNEISAKIQEIRNQSLNDSHSPLNETACRIREVPQLLESVLEKQSTVSLLPILETYYNPFLPFEDAPKLIQSQQTLIDLPETLWPELVNLFEDILTPATRTWLYDQISPHMPSFTKTGRSWYSPKRKLGIVTTLFPQKYKREEFYARIFPTPLNPEKALSQAKTQKARQESQRCSTISGCDRKFKILCVSLLNGLMEKEGIKARFIEIDLVSCHARVLCYLFPEKTSLLTRIFADDLSLWDEIISHIPEEIRCIIETKTQPKKLVKIVAYKILQSGLNKPNSILIAIEGFLMDLTYEEQMTVVESLRQNPVLEEFRTLFKEVNYRVGTGNCQVFSMFQKNALRFVNLGDPRNLHIKNFKDVEKKNKKKKTFEYGGETTPTFIDVDYKPAIGVEPMTIALQVRCSGL